MAAHGKDGLAETEELTGAEGAKKEKGWERVKKVVQKESEKKKETTNKWLTLTQGMKTGVADFFGVADKSASEKEQQQLKWDNRAQHLITSNFLFGGSKAAQTPAAPPSTDEVDFTCKRSKRMQRNQIPDTHLARRSVLGMVVNGVKHAWTGKATSRVAPRSRSFAPSCLKKGAATGRPNLTDDFFEYPYPLKPALALKRTESGGGDYDVPDNSRGAATLLHLGEETTRFLTGGFIIKKRPHAEAVDEIDGVSVAGMKRMASNVFNDIVDNTNRREVGVGFAGKCLDWEQNHIAEDPEVQKQLNELAAIQHRPYFTYWVIFVQIICFIFAIAVYGIAPIGISETRIEAEILKPSLSIEIVHYTEADNLWIGPRQADLIHLGARYSPCMRRDSNVEQAIAEDRKKKKVPTATLR